MYLGLSKVKKDAAEALIKAGALSKFLDMSRRCMWHELQTFNTLNKKQQDYIREHLADSNLKDALEFMIEQPTGKGQPCYNSRSVTKIQLQYDQFLTNYPEGDDPNRLIAKWERDYLGREFSCTELDNCELPPNRLCCRDIQHKNFIPKHETNLPIKITYKKVCAQKDKRDMCWVRGYDSTGNINSVAMFADIWTQHSSLIYEGNLVNLVGKPDNSIFIVQDVKQL
jgi:DNA polymerase III alpha subunit